LQNDVEVLMADLEHQRAITDAMESAVGTFHHLVSLIGLMCRQFDSSNKQNNKQAKNPRLAKF
jgi:hypothetical protein